MVGYNCMGELKVNGCKIIYKTMTKKLHSAVIVLHDTMYLATHYGAIYKCTGFVQLFLRDSVIFKLMNFSIITMQLTNK